MTSYLEAKLKGWQVNYSEAAMGHSCLADWGTHSNWKIMIFGKKFLELSLLDFKILMVKFTQIGTIYLDSNLPFKNSLGLKLQEEKSITSQVLLATASDHNPKLPNWLKSRLFHQQRQNHLASGTAGGLCQVKGNLVNVVVKIAVTIPYIRMGSSGKS